MKELGNLRTISSKIHFILQLGYFKAKKRFFILDPLKIKEDIEYILQRYFPMTDDFPNIDHTKPTRLSQKACILKLLNYQDCTKEKRSVRVVAKDLNHEIIKGNKQCKIVNQEKAGG